MPELSKKVQNVDLYYSWYDWAFKYAASYNFLLGSRDGWFGNQEDAFVREMQKRLHIVIDGVFGDRTAAAARYTWKGATKPPVVEKRRKIWAYSNPGSGANEFQGPSFQLFERAKNILKINHQPVHSEQGGYLGLMGGDSKLSYVDVNWTVYLSVKWLLEHNEDINDPEFEMWFSGYSQKAEGIEDALEMLFGDGGFIHPGDPTQTPAGPGQFRHLRDKINGIIQFGNPSTENTGISPKNRPLWMRPLIKNINYPNDFYAIATDQIRRRMYQIIIKAETELPFFIRVMKIAIKVITPYISIIGGILGPLGPIIVAGMAGIGNLSGLLGGLMGQAASAADEEVDRQIEEMFTLTGLIGNLPEMLGLLGALPGLQAHGGYEFDPVMMNRAFNIMEVYTRPVK